MKSALITVVFLSIFLARGQAQMVTYKDLVGTWLKNDTHKETLSFKFIDTLNLTVLSSTGETSRFTYKLIKNTGKGNSSISIINKTEGINHVDTYLLQIVDKNTLRFMHLDAHDGPVVDPSKIITAFFLVRT